MALPLQSLWRRILAHGARNCLPSSEGNAARLLDSGRAILEASRELIRGAERTLHFETYIWSDDRSGREMLELLKAARDRGVQIRGIVDHVGSWSSDSLLREARDGGMDVRAFHPISLRLPWRKWTRRNHRKLLIADGSRAIVSSANWGDDYNCAVNPRSYRDLGLELLGPILDDLSRDFAASWARVRGSALPGAPVSGPPEALPSGEWVAGIPIQMVSSLARRPQPMRRHLLMVLRQVRSSAIIASAYFVPDPQVLRTLARMARRGVQTDLLLPGTSDHPAIQEASRATFGRLLQTGVRIWERQGRMLHSKAAVLDREIVILGSANLDTLSFRRNLELNLVLRSRPLAEILETTLEHDRDQSLPWNLEHWNAIPAWRKGLQRMIYALWRWL